MAPDGGFHNKVCIPRLAALGNAGVSKLSSFPGTFSISNISVFSILGCLLEFEMTLTQILRYFKPP